jgi:hypothetical protein
MRSGGAIRSAPVRAGAPAGRVYAQSRGAYGGSAYRGGYAVPRSYGYGSYGHGGYGYGTSHVYAAPYHYHAPYYAFHSHFSLGFGLYVGYPVGFSAGFYYGYPYAYAPYYAPSYAPYYAYPPAPYPYYPPPAYPYPYQAPNGYPPANYPPPAGYPSSGYPSSGYPSSGYPPPGYSMSTSPEPSQAAPQPTMLAQPGTAAGSISFEITPSDAAVIVDGIYVGRVSELGPTTQPMGFKPGKHHVEIRASGYQTLSFEADVVAGQVLPFKGEMQPVR